VIAPVSQSFFENRGCLAVFCIFYSLKSTVFEDIEEGRKGNREVSPAHTPTNIVKNNKK
jgi:hypothetical protein